MSPVLERCLELASPKQAARSDEFTEQQTGQVWQHHITPAMDHCRLFLTLGCPDISN